MFNKKVIEQAIKQLRKTQFTFLGVNNKTTFDIKICILRCI